MPKTVRLGCAVASLIASASSDGAFAADLPALHGGYGSVSLWWFLLLVPVVVVLFLIGVFFSELNRLP
jgi:hypothetical protein